MRVSEERYSRDLRRLNLATTLLRHRVRSGLVMQWTGLPDRRLRTLRGREGHSGEGPAQSRHRGPPPRALSVFFQTAALRSEASAIAVLCQVYEVLPLARGPEALKRLPTVGRGERLCLAYEAYLAVVPDPKYSLEQVFLLLDALTLRDTILLGQCTHCQGAMLLDVQRIETPLCASCRALPKAWRDPEPVAAQPVRAEELSRWPPGAMQGSLF